MPKDENHPYGHGKVEFLASVTEGILIFLAGVFIMIKGAYSLFSPPQITFPDAGLYILLFTALVNFILGKILMNQGKKIASILLISEGKHLLADNLSTLVGMLGIFVMIITDMPEMDSLFSLVLGFVMLRSGYGIIRPSVAALMDEADDDLLKKISSLLNNNRKQDWIDIHNMRIVKYGSDIHIDCHTTIPYYYSLQKSHDVVSDIEKILRKNYPQGVEIFIHADPCLPPHSCKICWVSDCTFRKAESEKKVEWTPAILSLNRKHSA